MSSKQSANQPKAEICIQRKKAWAQKKCGPAAVVNGQMLSSTLKAFTFFDAIEITLIVLLAFVQRRKEAYFFFDFLVRFVSRQNEQIISKQNEQKKKLRR